ncbi:MAG: EAL domain-containing protein [Azospirillum sp.]|nr:EAL domain-containing protein [Azospirillum sp.]
MFDWLFDFLSSDNLTPHGFCLSWRPDLFWTMVVSDGVIALSYFSIPVVLVYFAERRRDLEFRWVLFLFGAFIVACGSTHVAEIWTLWVPSYGVEAVAKAVTAAVSLATAVVMWPLVPRVLAIPTRQDLEQANARLRHEAMERQLAGEALEALNRNQERLISERTADLKAANRQLVQEVAERQRAEQEARDRAHFIERLLESIPTPVFFKDEHYRYLGCNQAFENMFGVAEKDLVGRTVREVWPPAASEIFVQNDHALAVEPGIQVYETVFEGGDGRRHQVEFHKASLVKGDGSFGGLVGVVWDVTERNRAAEQIRFLAHHDPLTELPNRLLVRDRFEQAVAQTDRQEGKIGVAYLDLDTFKAVNDCFSHAVGDALLRGVALRLKGCIRSVDTVSRLGGDEFLIVLPSVAGADFLSLIALRVVEAVSEPFVIEGRDLSVTASIGIAVYPDDGSDLDTLLRKADLAMYRVKEAGRNGFRFFDRHIEASAVEHLALREQLRRALQRQEFTLHFQPEIDLASGAMVGAEALIRWNHPERGLVGPGDFIPVAEATGMIVPIGAWVLGEACRQAVAWREQGRPGIFVSVNLSAIQFKRGDLESTVAQALAESGLPPQLLELELTETILMSDIALGQEIIGRLKAMGVSIAIDDFGTGYSSLSYLRQLHVDKLKIDQSFIKEMCSNRSDAAIVCAIVLMARSIGLSTIAEGVEDEQVLDLLRLCRCDQAQGFHIARPLPAEEFVRRLDNPG